MKRSCAFVASALAFSFLPVSLAAGEAAQADCSPVTGDVVLTADVDCGAGLAGVLIVAPGATVDLGGHVLRGRVELGAGATLRGGAVDGSAALSALPFSCVSLASGSALDGVEVRGCREAVMAAGFAAGARIERSWLHDNGEGFYGPQERPSTGLVVRATTFERNGIGAVLTAAGDALVTGSTFRGNGQGVVIAHPLLVPASGQQVVQNAFLRNGIGVRVSSPTFWAGGGATIERNTFNDNRSSGIHLELARGSVAVTGNVLANNGDEATPRALADGTTIVPDDGITAYGYQWVDSSTGLAVQGLAGVTIAGNRAVRNADLGIEAVGAVDGGGNRAAGNGDPAQCAGVAC